MTLGRPAGCCGSALRLKRQAGNRFGEGEVLNEIGMMEREAGRPEEAADLHREALVAMTEAGDRIGQCGSRNLLARAHAGPGGRAQRARPAPPGARRRQPAAVPATSRPGRWRASPAACGATDPAAARAHLTRALALFRQIESPDQHEVERLLAELG